MAPLSNATFAQRMAVSLISGTLIFLIFYLGEQVFMPLAFGSLTAIILISPCDFLQRKGMSKGLAALTSVLLLIVAGIVILWFVSWQMISLRTELPALASHLKTIFDQLEEWIQQKMHLPDGSLAASIGNLVSKSLNNAASMLGSTVGAVSGALVSMVMIPIYTFLFLLYRDLIVRFVIASFKEMHIDKVRQVLQRTKDVINQYILGLLLEMTIVGVLYCIGFVLLGVKFGLLLGVVGALLNIIPYLGFFTAFLLSILITFSTNSPGTVLGVVIIMLVVHFFDANILMPKIVGSKIKINALFTIFAVIVGNAIWGIPGMFLALPFVAILKILFDTIGHTPPWGLLLGDDTNHA